MASITLDGLAINTNADLPAIGSDAPDFKLTAIDMSDKSLADYASRKKVLNIVMSVETPVCSNSVKKFNAEMAKRDDAVVLTISADLPMAQARYNKENSIGNIVMLSMMRNKNFAKDYGVLIQDGPVAGITARAVVVIDENNKVTYTQLVPEIANEPDYEAVLKVLN